MSVYDEILKRVQYDIEDGNRDLERVFADAFDIETDNNAQLWELIQDVYSPVTLLGMVADEHDAWADLYGHAYNEVYHDMQQFADDHVWTVYFCDGPNEKDWYDYDELYKYEDFADTVDELVGNGFLLVSIYDKEAYLEEVEEDEE